jgi:hypothetical protein
MITFKEYSMTSTVLNLNTLPARNGQSIGAALGEVALAFQHLATALLSKAFTLSSEQTVALTAFEEAEALRDFASSFMQQDPGFAQDLFAAADRHEIEAAKV